MSNALLVFKVYARSGDAIQLIGDDPIGIGFANKPTTLALGAEGKPIKTHWVGEEWTMPWNAEGRLTPVMGKTNKGFVGETSPSIDDPKPPFGEDFDEYDPHEFNPFGRR